MAEITKQALIVENNQSFPNNNTGYITPQKLRDFNTNMIDSTANQTIFANASGSWNVSINALNAYTAAFSASVDLTQINQATASLQSFTASATIEISNLESKSASVDISISNLNLFTASAIQVSSSVVALNAFTSSANQRLTAIESVSGSWITESETGSFAILGANNTFTGTTNTFNNNVNILGTLTATSASFQYTTSSVVVVGQNKILLNTDTPSVRFGGISVQDSGSVGNPSGSLFWDSQNNVWIYQHPSGSGEGYNSAILIAGPANSGSLGNEQTLTAGKIPVATGEDHISDSILTQTAAGITAAGNINSTGFISASNGFYSGPNTTALNIGDGSNIRFWSGSTGGSEYYNIQLVPGVGDIAFSRSGAGNVKTFTLAGVAGNNTTFQNNPVVFNDSVSSLTINAQSTAISGSGSVTVQASTITDTAASVTTNASASVRGTFDITGQSGGDGKAILLGHSGSLVIGNGTVNTYYGALAHISSSVANANTNLIFKTNTNTADTIISGSANLFVNPAAPTAGFKRYFGGSGNIALNASNVPQLSGSMAFSPTMNNNYFGGNSTTLIMRGPVSSSAYTISGNSIIGTVSIGSSAANNAEKLISGLTFTGNQIAGTLNVIANKTNLSSSLSFTGNNLNGTLTINANSSSLSITNNIINDGGCTITNNFFSSSAGFGSFAASRNNIGGTTNTLIAQGTASAVLSQPVISDNTIFGGSNTIFVDTSNSLVSGSTTYSHAVRNIVAGNNLIITGSSVSTDLSSLGSAYFGRYNALDGNKAKTAETIFAVGTGNATTRKTGFLIDSGSNTFVEGSLTISGSAYGTPIALSVSSNTASIDLAKSSFFTLSIPTATTTRVEATNIKPGQTINILLTQPATTGSLVFSNSFKWPSGFAYSASTTANAVDIVTLITFDSSSIYGTSVKNLV